ncbi:unnamed protein product [Mytilus coruscus]|uniref:Uncharacterized protein n=1 Tax=Mytilus coruscus TaxID=42192 RepID=A0A6J8D5G8_MYTCO|nr:unnamed protein product [Mytilus coruscus]
MLTEAAPANTDRFNPIAFQLKSLKTFGAIQMVLGGILATIGTVGLILDKSKKNCSFSLDTLSFLRFDFLSCENRSNDLIGMDGACLGLSIWIRIVIHCLMNIMNTMLCYGNWCYTNLYDPEERNGMEKSETGVYGVQYYWSVSNCSNNRCFGTSWFDLPKGIIAMGSENMSNFSSNNDNSFPHTTNINVANVVPSQVPGYQFPMGYQPNPYLQGQMPMQFTGAGQVPGNAPATSGYPLCPTSPYGMVQQSLSGGSPHTVNDKNIEID